MRVTNNMMIVNFLNDLARIEERSAHTQNKISSGIEIAKPSDDPAKAARILFFGSKISKVQQYQKNIDHITLWTSQTDTLLNDMYTDFVRAQNLAERGATGTMNQDQRNALAAEVNGLIEKLYSSANDKIENYYAFGGNNYTTAPFTANRDAVTGEITTAAGGVTFDPTSATGPRIEEILDGQTETVNENGDTLMLNGAANYFQTLIDLRDNLRLGTNIGTSLTNVKTVINDIDGNIARIGYKQEKLESIKNRLIAAELEYTKRKANLEEVDYVKAITDYQKDQTLYQSALAVGARLMQTSLIDFLR